MKKLLMLASLALAAAAVAAPAAQAGWLHNHEPLEGTAEASLIGEAVFFGGVNAFGCEEIEATLTAHEDGSGEIVDFNPETASCEGVGAFAGCELMNHVRPDHENPWPIDTVTGPNPDLEITNVTIVNEYTNCNIPQITGSIVHFPKITVEPLNGHETLDELTISGHGLSTPVTTVEAHGIFQVVGTPTLGLQT